MKKVVKQNKKKKSLLQLSSSSKTNSKTECVETDLYSIEFPTTYLQITYRNN